MGGTKVGILLDLGDIGLEMDLPAMFFELLLGEGAIFAPSNGMTAGMTSTRVTSTPTVQ